MLLMSRDAIKNKYNIESDETLIYVHGQPLANDLFSERVIVDCFSALEVAKKNAELRAIFAEKEKANIAEKITTRAKRRVIYFRQKRIIIALEETYTELVRENSTEKNRMKSALLRTQIKEVLIAIDNAQKRLAEIKKTKTTG